MTSIKLQNVSATEVASSGSLLECWNKSPTLACWIRFRNILKFDTCRELYFMIYILLYCTE